MSGTKELGEAVKFMCALASAVSDAAADGKATLADAARLAPVLYKLPSALDGLSEAIEEAKDLSAEEMDELSKMIKDELDLEDDNLEAICEEAVDCCLKLYSLVLKIKG
jgi:gamma-glutamyl phosphate reductase